jgi:hypothetical protein
MARNLPSLADLDLGPEPALEQVLDHEVHLGKMELLPHALSLLRVNVEMENSASSHIWIKRVTTVDTRM